MLPQDAKSRITREHKTIVFVFIKTFQGCKNKKNTHTKHTQMSQSRPITIFKEKTQEVIGQTTAAAAMILYRIKRRTMFHAIRHGLPVNGFLFSADGQYPTKENRPPALKRSRNANRITRHKKEAPPEEYFNVHEYANWLTGGAPCSDD